MRLLLDTHSFLWFTANAPQLSGNAKSLIENPENEVLLSIISIWEIAILISLGRIVSLSLSELVIVSKDAIFDQYGVTRLW